MGNIKCKRCDGNGWVLEKVKACDLSKIYVGKYYWLDVAKPCPICHPKAKKDGWQRDFEQYEGEIPGEWMDKTA